MFPAFPIIPLHRCTYADVYRRSRRLAEALQKAGLQRGDRVATLMWNHYAHVEAYLGIPACGGVIHTLNLRLAPQKAGEPVDVIHFVNIRPVEEIESIRGQI